MHKDWVYLFICLCGRWTYSEIQGNQRERALKMSTKVIGICCILVTSVVSAAYAQTPIRRYRPPAGPTLTPYLNYYRADLSTLPSNYDSFIVPQQRLQRNLYDLARTQQADFRKVETDIKQVRTSAAAPTGVGASFLNYSHYYRLPQGGFRQQ